MKYVDLRMPGRAYFLAHMPQLLDDDGHNLEMVGARVTLTDAALEVLAGLPEDHDGHYDGTHIWIHGSEYLVERTDDEVPQPTVVPDLPPLSPEDAEHAAEIDLWRAALEKGITGALAELRAADNAYQYLVDGLYDVEFAEGHGADIAHHLDVAAKALRAADALRHRAVTPTRTS